jgi:hypothetical protein
MGYITKGANPTCKRYSIFVKDDVHVGGNKTKRDGWERTKMNSGKRTKTLSSCGCVEIKDA